MSWIPDFKESFIADAHAQSLVNGLAMVLAPVPGKYEGHKALILYLCLTGLRTLGRHDLVAPFQPLVLKYIEASAWHSDDGLMFGESPFLKADVAHSGSHGLVTTYLQMASLTAVNGHLEPYKADLKTTLLKVRPETLDLRSLYSYCALKYILSHPMSQMEVMTIKLRVLSLRKYEQGFALDGFGEAHAAANFLAVACLDMIGELDRLTSRWGLVWWILNRQEEMGFAVS